MSAATEPRSAPPGRQRATLPARTRAPGTVRANRVVLATLGSVLLLAGVGGLLLGVGSFGDDLAARPVLPARVERWVADNTWFWPAIAAAAAVIAVLAAWWLVIQVRTDRLARLNLRPGEEDGRTVLQTDAVADALEEEIESYRGVARARARVSGRPAGPLLELVVTLDGRVEPGELRRRVESQAIAHARTALDLPALPVRLELVLPGRAERDVR